MHHKDIPACHDLLIHWRKQQGRKRPFLLDWGYTKAALDRYGMWSPEDLQGWCLEIGDRLVGFAMAGAIQRNLANFFVAKADPGIYGASEMLRYKVFQSLTDYEIVNDAGDLGLPGLRQHKQKFRPVARLKIYAAYTHGQNT